MELTGKALTDFDKWALLQDGLFDYAIENDDDKGIPTYEGRYFHYVHIHDMPLSMRYGVYVDFFDDFGMQIYVKPTSSIDNPWSVYIDNFGQHILTEYIDCFTRPEARTEAIKQANQIYNKQNK